MNPVGPKNAQVYWKRRALFLLALICAIIVIFFTIKSLLSSGDAENPSSSGNQNNSATPTPAVTPDPSPEPTATKESLACGSNDLEIEAITDSPIYAIGVDPKLSLSVTNKSREACVVDVGTAQQEFLVYSGNDRIWSSKDCQIEPTNNNIKILPGETKKANLAWNVSRSAPGECGRNLPATGSGTYLFTAILGDNSSEPVRFTIGS